MNAEDAEGAEERREEAEGMDVCRCREIEVLRDEEASFYAASHLAPTPPHHSQYDASLHWCRKTGLLFHNSWIITISGHVDHGPRWLRRVPGIQVTENGLSAEAAGDATRVGEDARKFHRPLVAHYIDQHGDGDVYSDPDTGVVYLFVHSIDCGNIKRPDELLAIAHLRATDFDRSLPLVSQPIRKRTCLNCSADMTNVPRAQVCPICGSGEGAEVARAAAASRAAAERTATPGGCSWVAALVIGGVVVALVVLLRLIAGPSA